ncbi:signal transducing kinase of the PAK [Tulasnella sp. 417]|nr:signal transducing kinase of the PAK [Tulasnella sp. 417]
MNTHSSSWQSCGSGGNLPRPPRANAILNDIAPSSDKLSSPQAILDHCTLPSLDPYGSPPPVALNGGNMVRKLRSSSQGKKKKGILGFMSDSSTPSKRPEIGTPYNLIHLTHVRSDSSAGEFVGLPAEWEGTLQKSSRQFQEGNRQAVAENLAFYRAKTGAPSKLARKYKAPGSAISQQVNGTYSLGERSQNPSTRRAVSDVPQGIIDQALEFICNNPPQQKDHHVEGGEESNQQRSDSALQEIEDEIDLMENTIESLLTGLRENLMAGVIRRKKERNVLVPFHQLPLEIASEILWLSIANPCIKPPFYSFLQRRRTISSVCSSWRMVVECSPRFWSIVELTATPEAITTLLKNSDCHPLEIKCFSNREYHWASHMSRRQGLEMIAPHTQRIRSLIVEAPSTEGILAVLDRPAPMMEELRLYFNGFELVRPIDLFCGQASRLRDVALVNIPVRWDSRALEGLRSLKIKATPAYSPTETEVISLLEVNPGLETLNIEDVRVTEDFADGVWPPRSGSKQSRVIMGNMREMRLFSLSFELVRIILGYVEIPSIEHLHVKCLFRGHPASQLLGPNIQHLVPPIIRRSTGAQLAELTIGEENLGLAIYLPYQVNPAIRIQLDNTAPVSGCGWLVENLFTPEGLPGVGEPETFQVDLKFGGSFDMQGGAFGPILGQLDAVEVKSLVIDRGCKHGEELIDYLGEMKEDSQWPLPHLTSLTVEGEASTATHLLAALQARKHGADLTRMASLEELNIEGLGGIDLNVEDDLEELMGHSRKFIRAARSWYGEPLILPPWSIDSPPPLSIVSPPPLSIVSPLSTHYPVIYHPPSTVALSIVDSD